MFQREPGFSPHQNLWQAVLRLAVDDAILGPTEMPNRLTFLSECERARAFLTTASDDLMTVCHNAGVNPRAVLERMRDRIAQAPTPEELHNQPRPSRAVVAKPPKRPKAVPFKDQPYTIHGEARTAAEWCARTGISLDTARARLNQAWSPERAFTLTRAEALLERKAAARQSYRAAMQRTGQTRRKRAPSASTPRYLHGGLNLTLAEWSERTGIKKTTLYKRVVLTGWTVSKALTTTNTLPR